MLDTGYDRTPIASDRNTKAAHVRRMDQIDILYPGAFTSRQKRYAAVPAPDMAKVTLIDERTANFWKQHLQR
jgi:hypothetical protein